MIFPAQLRAARALLSISQQDLANRSGVGIATIKRIELGDGISGAARTIAKLQNALERDGILFVSQDDEHGPGVRLGARLATPD